MFQLKSIISNLIIFLLLSSAIYAQQPVNATIVAPVEPDDASVATGLSPALNLNLNYTYDGSVWRRVTFGIAGVPSTQVSSVQGISLGLPLTVFGQDVDFAILQNAVTTNGVGTVTTTGPYSSIVLTVICTGCSGGTKVNFEGTTDTTDQAPLYGYQVGSATSPSANSTTTAGVTYWIIPTYGFPFFQARVSNYSAGTVTVWASRSVFTFPIPPVQTISGSVNATLQVQNDTTMVGGVNIKEINGVAPLMGSGNTGTGSPRITIATDQPALTNPLLVTPGANSNTGSAVPAKADYLGSNQSGVLAGIITCNGYAKDRSTTADVQLVAISGSTVIYVCGYRISGESTTTSDVNLRYATNSNCTSGATDLTPATTLGTSTSGAMIGGVVIPPGIWSGLKTPASDNLCVHRSAVQTSEVEVWYTQF